MKLRNKKTGKIQEIVVMPVIGGYPDETVLVDGETSLKEFNNVWEDYEPKEALIKDKEIRGIVRAWADVNDAGKLKYNSDENSLDDIYRNTITFNMDLGFKDGEEYTITELCGEDEE